MKQKGLVILGVTAALTLGTGAFAALAATAGWVQNNGAWQYQDKNGSIVTSDWKTGADGKYRYLNSQGYIATDTWIDGEYYVGTDGIMVAGTWLQVNGVNTADGTGWYYFGTNGKLTTNGWKKVDNKWYYFDDSGLMQTGWVDDGSYSYYIESSGQMAVGWKQLDPPDGYDYSSDSSSDYDPFMLAENNGQYWYYFKSNGRKLTPKDDGGENGVVRIDGSYYCMNEDGALQFGWKNVNSDTGITGYKYFLSNGKMVTGWYSQEGPKNLEDTSGDINWYYFNSKGVPKADEDGIVNTKDMLSVGGKSYLFNSAGNPVYGLRQVYLSDDADGSYTTYYFGKDENSCWAHKGKQQVEEDDGEVCTYYFLDSGRGYTGVKDNYLYYMGKLQAPQDGKYMLITMPGKDYAVLVNSSGKIMKNSTVKDTDGTKYKTNSAGTVIKIDDEEVSGIKGEDPMEPNYMTD